MIARMTISSTAVPPRTVPMTIPVVRDDPMFTGDAVEACDGAVSEVSEEGDGRIVLPVPAGAVGEDTSAISVNCWEKVTSLSTALGVDAISGANTPGEESDLVLEIVELDLDSSEKLAGAEATVRGTA
jgi:hypothetical protein